MSVVVVKIKNEENAFLIKRLIAVFQEKAKVLSDAEFRDSMFSKLLDDGRKSKLLTQLQSKKELIKRRITV